MTTEGKCLIGTAVLVASMIYGCPAFCEFIVVNSQTLEVGIEILDTRVVHLRDQEELRLMDKKTGETILLIGPYNDTVGNYHPPKEPKERSRELGATRGLRKEQ
jgi:hypothetical protein